MQQWGGGATQPVFAIYCEARTNFPNLAVSTDVIVGFPETEGIFSTRWTVRECAFNRLHIFPFRRGCTQAQMRECPRRGKELTAVCRHWVRALTCFPAKIYGRTVAVLFER